ncbi:MAG: hypothetical protein HS126_37375 [Anaerolineales bacterium]|nr:hypothetical protein [Anaerolineales bacterium]
MLNLLNQEKKETRQVALTEIVELSDLGPEHGVEVQDDFDLKLGAQPDFSYLAEAPSYSS